MTSAVIVSLRVKATPARAFEVFTQEIDAWWQASAFFPLTPRGDGTLRFEPGEGGRLVTTLPNGKEFEIGRILIWAPGEKLVFTWRQAPFPPDLYTEVEVLFETVGEETRVSIEHRGWDRVPQDHAARHGFPLEIFQRRFAERLQRLLKALRDHLARRPGHEKAQSPSGDRTLKS